MTKDKKGRQYYVSQETHNQLIAIGRANGAAEGREASPGIRVAARYHGRLVELLAQCSTELSEAIEVKYYGILGYPSTDRDYKTDMAVVEEARLLLREIEEAR